MRDRWAPFAWVLVAVVARPMAGCHTVQCNPATQQPCTQSGEGGASQTGYQVCDSNGTWSECIVVGACAAAPGQLPAYARCTSQAQCGPTSCASCSPDNGVDNPGAYSLCQPYCQQDADCAPTTPTVGVTPRCLLLTCALFCNTTSACPNDTRCLPFANPDVAAQYPGFMGLCE